MSRRAARARIIAVTRAARAIPSSTSSRLRWKSALVLAIAATTAPLSAGRAYAQDASPSSSPSAPAESAESSASAAREPTSAAEAANVPLAATSSRAPAPAPAGPEDPIFRPRVAERRSGVVIGVAPGVAFAGASGYPNNAGLIGNPAFYSESPLLVGASTTYFLMGALTDYVSFGPMVNIAKFESEKWTSTGVGIGFRLEAFPLVRLVPSLADTAIYVQGGVGSTELQAKGPFPSADGTQSFAGVGLHHELRLFGLLGGHVSGGPYVEYDVISAPSAERHWASVGFRIAWYGGKTARR